MKLKTEYNEIIYLHLYFDNSQRCVGYYYTIRSTWSVKIKQSTFEEFKKYKVDVNDDNSYELVEIIDRDKFLKYWRKNNFFLEEEEE